MIYEGSVISLIARLLDLASRRRKLSEQVLFSVRGAQFVLTMAINSNFNAEAKANPATTLLGFSPRGR